MRVPWFIYAPLSLLVLALALYICIHDIDIVTPPSQEATAESIKTWRKDNPSIRDTKVEAPIIEAPIALTLPKPPPRVEKPTPIKHPPKLRIPSISPALHSLVKQNLTLAELTIYAETMLSHDKPQLARIAYERIIDCAKDATDEDRKDAASAISKLLDKTPLWNPDPSVRKNITVNLTLNKAFNAESKKMISELEELIFNASDGMLNPVIKLKSSSGPDSSLDIGKDTQLVKFKIEKSSDLLTKIPAALFYSISTRNNQSQKLITTPPLPKHISPKQALQTYITRLAWVNAAQ